MLVGSTFVVPVVSVVPVVATVVDGFCSAIGVSVVFDATATTSFLPSLLVSTAGFSSGLVSGTVVVTNGNVSLLVSVTCGTESVFGVVVVCAVDCLSSTIMLEDVSVTGFPPVFVDAISW